MDLIQMIRNGQNPQQLVLSLLSQANPFEANLLELAKNDDTAGIEQIARNIAQSKGLDYEKEFTNFKNMLGL